MIKQKAVPRHSRTSLLASDAGGHTLLSRPSLPAGVFPLPTSYFSLRYAG